MKSQTRKQIIAIYIVSNNWINKDNQVIEFGQLTEYNIRNYFLEISYTKWGGEASPSSFHKKSKLSVCLDQQSEM